MIRTSPAATLYYYRYSFWCLVSITVFLNSTPTDCSFGVPAKGGWKVVQQRGRRHLSPHPSGPAEDMALSPSMGVVARAVGRRSRRLLAIRSSNSGAALSLSLTNDERQTSSREASIAVPITPSPSKEKATKKTKTLSESLSPGRKRKRSTILPDVPVSRRLDLKDKTVALGPSSVENNDLQLTTDMVAAINPSQAFIDLEVPPEELRPSNTLTTGQCFHWRVVHQATKAKDKEPSPPSSKTATSAWGTYDATEWVGTLRLRLFESCESVVLVVRELPDTTLYRPLKTTRTNKTTEDEEMAELHRAVKDYFQLGVSLPGLYEEWSAACPRLATIAECIPGVRIIRQDPWECLVSFICSSNNNIPRITKMLASIRSEYGRPLFQIPAAAEKNGVAIGQEETLGEYLRLYSFPSLEELASQATDKDLRGKCGMGYRAGYILETARILREECKGGEAYLWDVLREMEDPAEVQDRLCEFRGVGKKVADCVALFSLNQDDAIPVDTHVWNIAIRDYDPDNDLKTTVRSLTPSNYRIVGDIFRSRFQSKAGWAHSLLFVAELPSFRGLLPASLVGEMETFQKEEKERKKLQQEEKKKKKTKTKTKK